MVERNPATRTTDPKTSYRPNSRHFSAGISNAASKQAAFLSTHTLTAAFKLDFVFNGAGAVVNNGKPAYWNCT